VLSGGVRWGPVGYLVIPHRGDETAGRIEMPFGTRVRLGQDHIMGRGAKIWNACNIV